MAKSSGGTRASTKESPRGLTTATARVTAPASTTGGYSANAQRALEQITPKLNFYTEVEPAYNGRAIRLSNIGYREYNQLCNDLTNAGFTIRDTTDYYPGDNERGSEGVIYITGYKRRR